MVSSGPATRGALLDDRVHRGRPRRATRTLPPSTVPTWQANSEPETTDDLLTIAIDEPAPRVLVARVSGELDMSSAPDLVHVLGPLLDEPFPPRLVLDLTHLRFLGLRGVTALIELHERTAAGDGRGPLRLAGLHPAVARALKLTGTLAMFDLHDSVASAMITPR